MKKLVPTILIALLTSALPLEAVLMSAGSSDEGYRNFGESFLSSSRVLWLKQILNDGSAVGYASATPINSQYAITSAHLVSHIMDKARFEVGLGSNYSDGSGSTIAVSSVLVYPGYVYPLRDGPDVAILKLATPLPNFQQVAISSVNPGDIVAAAGYGFAMRPGDPVPSTRDGYVRGWNGKRNNFAPIASSAVFYQSTNFGSNEVSLEGKLIGGDSGGPVYNQAGELVGLNTAQSGNGGLFGTSIYLNLSQADVKAWILANTTISEPPRLTVTVTAPSAYLSLANLVSGREYRIMRSPTLTGWEEAHRFTPASTEDSWNDSLVTGGRMFYRLEWNE